MFLYTHPDGGREGHPLDDPHSLHIQPEIFAKWLHVVLLDVPRSLDYRIRMIMSSKQLVIAEGPEAYKIL